LDGGPPSSGLSPSMVRLSRRFCWQCLCNSSRLPQPRPEGRFGLIRFRSPLLTESRLISFPPGTEMFQFPGLAPDGLCIHPPVTPSACAATPGYPIRRSPDQGPFDGSPGLIAAYHVLHRLSTPRHPPHTLSSLTTLTSGSRRSSRLRRICCRPVVPDRPTQTCGSIATFELPVCIRRARIPTAALARLFGCQRTLRFGSLGRPG